MKLATCVSSKLAFCLQLSTKANYNFLLSAINKKRFDNYASLKEIVEKRDYNKMMVRL